MTTLRIRNPSAIQRRRGFRRSLTSRVGLASRSHSRTRFANSPTASCRRRPTDLRMLCERSGLRQESRIALLLLDSVEFPIAFWGAIRAGIIPIPLNSLLTTEQYAYVLDDSRAEAMVISEIAAASRRTGHRSAEPSQGSSSSSRREAMLRRVAAIWRRTIFDEILAHASRRRPFKVPTVSDEIAFWLYSSGSTGGPKGVKHVHTSLIGTARGMGQGAVGIERDDVVFSAAKLFFAYGLGNAMAFPMSVGASDGAGARSGRRRNWCSRLMRRHRPTLFFGGPALYAALLLHKDIGRGAGSDRLRLCVSAGDALPASTRRSVGARSSAPTFSTASARLKC